MIIYTYLTDLDKEYIKNNLGKSVPSIAKQLGRSYSSVRNWVYKYESTEQNTNRRKNVGGTAKAEQWRLDAINRANNLFNQNKSDPFFISGLCLYWAEGTKKDLAFSNSDTIMIKIFHNWFNRYLPGYEQVMVIKRPVESNEKELIEYWGNVLPNMRSYKPTISKNTKTKYGVVSIEIRGVKSDGIFIEELLRLLREHMVIMGS